MTKPAGELDDDGLLPTPAVVKQIMLDLDRTFYTHRDLKVSPANLSFEISFEIATGAPNTQLTLKQSKGEFEVRCYS